MFRMLRQLRILRATEEAARRRVRLMGEAFEAAEVSPAAIAQLEPAMTNDPKDRHVLAAAVASPAQVVVTLNRKDFPDDACEPFGIQARHPDDFLMSSTTSRRTRCATRSRARPPR